MDGCGLYAAQATLTSPSDQKAKFTASLPAQLTTSSGRCASTSSTLWAEPWATRRLRRVSTVFGSCLCGVSFGSMFLMPLEK